MWPGHMGNFGWGGILIGGLLMLLFWGGVIALAFFAIRGVLNAGSQDHGTEAEADRPLQLLKERYASGEITREEFQQMRRDLED